MKIFCWLVFSSLSATTAFGQEWVSICLSNNSVFIKTDKQARPMLIGVDGEILSDNAYDCAGDICSSPGAEDTTRFLQFFPSNSGRIGNYKSITSTITLNGNQLQTNWKLSCSVSSVKY